MRWLRKIVYGSLWRSGVELRRRAVGKADPSKLGKAREFIERHREIISDPLNLLIERVPEAGFIDEYGHVVLHNGNRVPFQGPEAYYGAFSDILVLNRGVHEPLEEFCFQQLLRTLGRQQATPPTMIEVGAYWAHYSMWLKKAFPRATCIMIEPDPENLKAGVRNFAANSFDGIFINAGVGGERGVALDSFIEQRGLAVVDVLHADVQGYEESMITGCATSLANQRIGYLFVSTHTQKLHHTVCEQLLSCGYRIEVSSDYDSHTTSGDGFVLASAPNRRAIFKSFTPLGRLDICNATPVDLVAAANEGLEAGEMRPEFLEPG